MTDVKTFRPSAEAAQALYNMRGFHRTDTEVINSALLYYANASNTKDDVIRNAKAVIESGLSWADQVLRIQKK